MLSSRAPTPDAGTGCDRVHALGATSAWLAVPSGRGGWLAPVVAATASFFTVALIWVDRTHAS